jgi:spermidine/putrescine transport system permease protein
MQAPSQQTGERLTSKHHLIRSVFTSGPAVVWMLSFLLVPLLAITVISFMSRGQFGELERPFTLENYQRFAGFGLLGFDLLYPMVIVRSLVLGAVTVIFCVLLGLPMAFFISGLPRRFKNLALTLVVIPLWTNLLIRTYAWQILLAPNTFLSHIASALGFIAPGEPLCPSLFAIYLGMVCDFLPFLVLPLYASVEKLDWHIVEAAMDLGADGRRAFRHAILPQIMPGLVAGIILVFIPATGQFVIPDLLGGSKTLFLGNAIQVEFGSSRDWPFGAAITMLAIGMVMAGLWFYSKILGKKGEPDLI